MVIVFEAHAALTPAGKAVEVPNAGANIMKSFTSVIPLLFKSVGQDATKFMVPVALTVPQPPVKGIE